MLTQNRNFFTKSDSLCLKGIAIIIMMFHHCFRSVERFENYVVDFSPFSQSFVVNISDYFKICVSIFAFITGYGLYLSAKNECRDLKSSEQWIASRLIKTMGGFWFVYILVFIITMICDRYPISVYNKLGFIRAAVYALIDFFGLANLVDTPTLISTWWYMSAAIFFIIIIPLAIAWSKRFGYISLIVISMALPRLLADGYPGGTNAYTFITPVIAGMIFAQYDIFKKLDNIWFVKNKIRNEIVQFVLYLTLLLLSIVVWIKFPRDKLWEYHCAVAPVIAICFCKKYVIRIPVLKNLLAVCGKYSMNIFLIHSFIRVVYFQDFIYGFKYFWLIVLVLFSISFVIAVVIEQIKKLIRWDIMITALRNKVCAVIKNF